MANYNMDNVSLFHSFSKVAAADNTALAAAVNKAGHVVTASDVWANEIPFCGSADSLADIKTKFADNTAFPVGTLGYDLSTSKLYQKGTEDWTEITQAAAGGYVTISYKDKPVLRWYNKAQLTLLTPENNGAPSNGFSAKYLGPAADGVGAISQFVSSTDKIVNGIVSDGYDVAVFDGTKKLTKGTSTATADNQWMDSAYAGMILFMCAQTSKNLSMTCFEYVGDKLETSLSDIRQSIKDISDVTLKGVVASVTADENTAQKAGITVDNEVSTTPVIKFTAGSVTTGETKLVSGGAVAAVTDALAGRIAALEGVKLSVQVVDAVPTTPVINTLYLVPEQGSTTGTYVEYIAYKPEGSETVTTERIGTTAVDLEGYTTDAEHTALADRVTALDAATTGRVAVVEGKVSTLEEQVATITSTDSTKEGSIAKALADAKTYAEGQATTKAGEAQAAAIAAAKTETETQVGAAKTEIKVTTDALAGRLDTAEGEIDTLQGQVAALTTGETSVDSKIAAAKTELSNKSLASTSTGSTLVTVATAGTVGTGMSTTVDTTALTTAIDTAKSGAIAAAKTETETQVGELDTKLSGQISALGQIVESNKTETDKTTDALAADIQSIKDVIGEGDNGENIIDILSGIRTDLNATTTTANSAAQSAEGDTYVSASQSGTKITVNTNINAIDSKLAEEASVVGAAIKAAKQAGVAAGDAASQALATAKTQTLAQTGTFANMFTVQTAGTVGTGIESITITDAGLSKKISDAESNAVTTALGSTITSVTAKDVETSPKVTVTLSGTVQTPVLQVVTDDIASAKELAELKQTVTDKNVTTTTAAQTVGVTATGNAIDVATATYTPATADAAGSWSNEAKLVTGTEVKEAIADINSKIDTLHSAAVTYQVFATLPTATAEHKGMVALVPANSGDSAVAGTYVEYLCVESVSGDTKTYSWQRIGTTAADFNQYAKSVTINGSKVSTATATGDINLGTVVTSINNPSGIENSTLIHGIIATDGKLTLGVASATTTLKGVVQLTDTVTASDSTMAVTGKAVAQAISTAVSDAELTFTNVRNGQAETENDLWGTTISEVDGVVTVSDGWVTNPNMSDHQAWNVSITKVEDNKAYTSAGFFANVQTEKIKDGSYMFTYCENLASFDSDLTNLENGSNTFAGAKFTSFNVDLPSLTNGNLMFSNCVNLTSFDVDLSSLTNGNLMFNCCTNLTSFTSDLSSLTNGGVMFNSCDNLTAFTSDLSSLTSGQYMFDGCSKLTTFTSDLSSLMDGRDMFYDCKLNTESLMFIADTINDSVTDKPRINLGIGNTSPTEEEVEYLNEIHEKGWQVYVNGSKYTPAQASATTTLDENGQEVSTPIPFWAKPVEVTEEEAEYVGEDGKFYCILGGQFIFVSDPDTYGMFTCLEDAAANMRLTKIEK